MKNAYEIRKRTFAAQYAVDDHEKAVMNGNVMTSEYGPEDKWAVLENGEPIMLFKTEEEARKRLMELDEEIQ